MSVPENKDIRVEYERLLRAVHQRLEVETAFKNSRGGGAGGEIISFLFSGPIF